MQTDSEHELHADEPWNKNRHWKRGVIPGWSKGIMIGLWAAAAFWNVVSLPILGSILKEMSKGPGLYLVGLVMPLTGAGLVIAAIWATLCWLKYGRVEFVMQSVPGVIGGTLVGAIRIPRHVDFEDGVTVALHCIRVRKVGRGESGHFERRTLWHRAQTVSCTDVRLGPPTLIPVVFAIASQCRETNDEKNIHWRLDASGATPGFDFRVSFTVPVFKTQQSEDLP